jgi:hypothetical protein
VLRVRPLLVAVAVGLLALPAGCGGSDDEPDTPKPPPSANVPPPKLAARDSRAFREIQRSSGVLRAAVVPVTFGAAPRVVAAARLNAAAGRVAKLRPRDPLLRRLRASVLDALRTTASEGAQRASAKRAARAAVGEADRIDAGLRRYAASHPAANSIAPG